LGVKDYLVHRLTGRLVTDHSCASGTGLLEMRTLDWYSPALAVAGIGPGKLPELAAPTEILSLTTHIDGLPPDVPVVLGAADGPLANLGTGAVRPGMAALSLGTSG